MEQPGQVGGHNLGRIFIRSYPVIYANNNVGLISQTGLQMNYDQN
jgi:hypothetical protein